MKRNDPRLVSSSDVCQCHMSNCLMSKKNKIPDIFHRTQPLSKTKPEAEKDFDMTTPPQPKFIGNAAFAH